MNEPEFPQKAEPSSSMKLRVKMFVEFLQAEGFRPTVDEDDDIHFKFEGMSFLISLDARDEEYFRVACPNIWSIDSDEERVAVQSAALAVSKELKLVKVIPVNGDTWVTVEMVCSPIQSAQDVLLRCLESNRMGVSRFRELMRSQD